MSEKKIYIRVTLIFVYIIFLEFILGRATELWGSDQKQRVLNYFENINIERSLSEVKVRRIVRKKILIFSFIYVENVSRSVNVFEYGDCSLFNTKLFELEGHSFLGPSHSVQWVLAAQRLGEGVSWALYVITHGAKSAMVILVIAVFLASTVTRRVGSSEPSCSPDHNSFCRWANGVVEKRQSDQQLV